MSFRPEALTGALFDSVCDDDAFAALPRLIAGLTGAVSVHFQTHGVTGVCTQAQYGHSDGVLDGYKAYFWEKDPWIEGYRETAFNTVVSSDALISEIDFLNSEIYFDLLRTAENQVRCLGMVLNLGSQGRFLFGIHRARGRPEFEADLQQGFEALSPMFIHLIQARRRAAAAPARLAKALVDHEQDAVMVVGADGGVHYANAAAQRLVERRRPLRVEAGRISAADPGLAGALARAVAWACAGRGGKGLEPELSPGYRIAVDRLGGMDRHLACVRVRDESEHLRRTVGAARAAYGLSAAEADLAEGLAQGLTLSAYAAWRGVTLATVKTQLANLFAKTGVSRQSDLVRLLWSGS